MSRVRDNLIGSGNSGSEVNGKIEQYSVHDDNNINAGDMVKFINSEIVKDTKEVEKEAIEEITEDVEIVYNFPRYPKYLPKSQSGTNSSVIYKLDDNKLYGSTGIVYELDKNYEISNSYSTNNNYMYNSSKNIILKDDYGLDFAYYPEKTTSSTRTKFKIILKSELNADFTIPTSAQKTDNLLSNVSKIKNRLALLSATDNSGNLYDKNTANLIFRKIKFDTLYDWGGYSTANGHARITNLDNGEITEYLYTGNMQEVKLQAGRYKLECWGASGGHARSNISYYQAYVSQIPFGAYSTGVLTLSETTTIYIVVGGQGNYKYTGSGNIVVTGGYNGGGNTYGSNSYYYCSGGGATDIRIGTNSLYARVIVAGGGSGGREDYSGTGYYSSGVNSRGRGIDSNNINSFGQGQSYTASGGTIGYGGGGGWYGGLGSYGGTSYTYTSSTASEYPEGCLLNSSYYLTDTQIVIYDNFNAEHFDDISTEISTNYASEVYTINENQLYLHSKTGKGIVLTIDDSYSIISSNNITISDSVNGSMICNIIDENLLLFYDNNYMCLGIINSDNTISLKQKIECEDIFNIFSSSPYIIKMNNNTLFIAGNRSTGLLFINDDYSLRFDKKYIRTTSSTSKPLKIKDDLVFMSSNLNMFDFKQYDSSNKYFDNGFYLNINFNNYDNTSSNSVSLDIADGNNILKDTSVVALDDNYILLDQSGTTTLLNIENTALIENCGSTVIGQTGSVSLKLNSGNVLYFNYSNNTQTILKFDESKNITVSSSYVMFTGTVMDGKEIKNMYRSIFIKEVKDNLLLYIYPIETGCYVKFVSIDNDGTVLNMTDPIAISTESVYKILDLGDNKYLISNDKCTCTLIYIDPDSKNINILDTIEIENNYVHVPTSIQEGDTNKTYPLETIYSEVEIINDKIYQSVVIGNHIEYYYSSGTRYQIYIGFTIKRLLSINNNKIIIEKEMIEDKKSSYYNDYGGYPYSETNSKCSKYFFSDKILNINGEYFYIESYTDIPCDYSWSAGGSSGSHWGAFMFNHTINKLELNDTDSFLTLTNMNNRYGMNRNRSSFEIPKNIRYFKLTDNKFAIIIKKGLISSTTFLYGDSTATLTVPELRLDNNYVLKIFVTKPNGDIVEETYDKQIKYNEVVDSGISDPSNVYRLFGETASKNLVTQKVADNTVLMVYNDKDSNVVTQFATTDTLSGNITYTDPIQFRTGEVSDIIITNTTLNKVLITYKDSTSLKAVVGNISGTTITVSDEISLVDNISSYHVALSDFNKVMIVYTDTNNKAYIRVYNVLENSLSAPLVSQAFNNAVNMSSVILTNLSTDKVVMSYTDINNSNYLTSTLVTLSGTSLAFSDYVASEYIQNPSGLETQRLSATEVYLTYNTTSHVGYSAKINIEDDVITYTKPTQFAENVKNPTCRLMNTNQLLLLFQNSDNDKLYSMVHDLNKEVYGDIYLYNNTASIIYNHVPAVVLDNTHVYTAFNETVNDRVLGNSCLLTVSFTGLSIEVSNQLYDIVLDDMTKETTVNKYKVQSGALTTYTESVQYNSIDPVDTYANIAMNKGNHLNTVGLSDNRTVSVFADASDFNRGVLIVSMTDSNNNTTSNAKVKFEDLEVTGISATAISENSVLIIYRTLANSTGVGNAIVADIDSNGIVALSAKYKFTDSNHDIDANGSFTVSSMEDNKALLVYNDSINGCIVSRTVNVNPGNIVTFGDMATFGSCGNYMELTTLSTNRAVLVYNDASIAGSQLVVLSVGGENVSVGNSVRFTTRTTTYKSIITLTSNKVLVSYVDATNNNIVKSFIARVSGTTIVYEPAVEVSDVDSSYVRSIKVANNLMLYVYRNALGQAVARLAVLKGSTLELHSPVVFNIADAGELSNININLTKLTDDRIAVTLNENKDTSLITQCTLFINYSVTIDSNIDGIAKSSGNDGDKINVYIPDNN